MPEIGDHPYRIHLINVSQVIQSLNPIDSGQLPTAIELKDEKFSLIITSIKQDKSLGKSLTSKSKKKRIQLNSIYSKDQKHVYYETADESGQIENADPNSFQLLSNDSESAYTKDSKKVFFYGKTIPSADAKSFVQMNDRYGKDVNHVYFMESILAEADVSSFLAPFQSVWYAKDKNHIFSGNKILMLADPQSFGTGDDRSCGKGCLYRSEDKNYRFDNQDNVVQKTVPAK